MKILGKTIKDEVVANATVTRGAKGQYWFTVKHPDEPKRTIAIACPPGYDRQKEAHDILQLLVDITAIEVEHVDNYKEAPISIGG